MAQNIPQCCVGGPDKAGPKVDDNIPMEEAASGGKPHRGQEKGRKHNQGQQHNHKVPGSDQQERAASLDPQTVANILMDLNAEDPAQPPRATPVNLNQMQGNVPPELIKRLEYKCLLEKLHFSIEVAQAIAHHGYDTAKKLSWSSLMTLIFQLRSCIPQAENAMMKQKTQEEMYCILHNAL